MTEIKRSIKLCGNLLVKRFYVLEGATQKYPAVSKTIKKQKKNHQLQFLSVLYTYVYKMCESICLKTKRVEISEENTWI